MDFFALKAMALPWICMRNRNILPSANPHLEFLVANSCVDLYGDADFDVYACPSQAPFAETVQRVATRGNM
jgi:hypothetical protein